MMKKNVRLFSTIISIAIVFLSFPLSVLAVEDAATETPSGETTLPIEMSAKSAVLMEVETGTILLQKNSHEKMYPASVTKIMSMLLVMEAVDSGKIAFEDVVTASADACAKGGSQIWLEPGEQMTVHELLKATAVGSANDACTALAEHVAGSEEGFVTMMNERAKQLGMECTHFDNCTGLDDTSETHLTCANDIALMSKELIRHEKIIEYTTIWMDTLRNGETELTNTNKLVRFYSGTTGLKTGTTSKAGHCLSATARRDGLHLIAVVMGCSDSTERFNDTKRMLNWGFANYTLVTPEIDRSLITDVKVINGIEKILTPEILETTPILVQKNKKDSLQQTVSMSVDVQAPVEQNQRIGSLTIMLDGNKVAEYQIISPKAIKKITVIDAFMILLRAFGK